MLPVTAVFAIAFMGAAFNIRRPEAIALCADARAALEKAGITHKAAAIDMETRTPKLSAQLNGHEPFTLWCRFSALPDTFWKAFNEIRAERFGQRVVANDIGRLIDAIDGLRMAKMTLPNEEQERERA